MWTLEGGNIDSSKKSTASNVRIRTGATTFTTIKTEQNLHISTLQLYYAPSLPFRPLHTIAQTVALLPLVASLLGGTTNSSTFPTILLSSLTS